MIARVSLPTVLLAIPLFFKGGLGSVTAKLFLLDSTCSSETVAFLCNNLAHGACCHDKKVHHGNAVESVVFDGLPVNAIASIYKADGSNPCGGKKCNSGPGFDVCLSCNGGPEPPFAGAKWENHSANVAKRDTLNDVDSERKGEGSCVEPDAIQGRGRKFKINYAVPSNATNEIVDMMMSSFSMELAEEDIPSHLKQHEILN